MAQSRIIQLSTRVLFHPHHLHMLRQLSQKCSPVKDKAGAAGGAAGAQREKKQCVHTTNWKNKGANKLAETKFAPIKTQQTQKLHKSKLFFLFASCERRLGSSLKAGMHDYEGKPS